LQQNLWNLCESCDSCKSDLRIEIRSSDFIAANALIYPRRRSDFVRRFVLEAREQVLQFLAAGFELGADGELVQPVNAGEDEKSEGDR
jgi:hypothetical protein